MEHRKMPARSFNTIFLHLLFLWAGTYFLSQTEVETLHQWFINLQASSFESVVLQVPRFAAVQNYLLAHDNPTQWERVVCFLALTCSGFVVFLLLMICLFSFDVKRHWKSCEQWLKPDYFQRLGTIKWRVFFSLSLAPASFWFLLVRLPDFETHSRAREWLIVEDFGFFFFSLQVLWLYLISMILIVNIVRLSWDVYLKVSTKNDATTPPPIA